jgi:hypothetical protein
MQACVRVTASIRHRFVAGLSGTDGMLLLLLHIVGLHFPWVPYEHVFMQCCCGNRMCDLVQRDSDVVVMCRQPIYESTGRVASIPADPWLGLRDTEVRSAELLTLLGWCQCNTSLLEIYIENSSMLNVRCFEGVAWEELPFIYLQKLKRITRRLRSIVFSFVEP